MDFTKDNIFLERPTLFIDLRFPRNVECRVRRPFSTDSPKFIDSLLAAHLARLTSLQRLKPVENTRFVFVTDLFSLLSRLGRGSRFEKNLDVNLPQTRFPGAANVPQSSRLLFVKSIQASSSGILQTELAGDHAEVSSVPGSADIPSAPVQAAPTYIKKSPSIVKSFQSLFSRALHTKSKGYHAEVPPVREGIDASAGSAISFAEPSDVSRLLTVKHSTFVKHLQALSTGTLQTEPVGDQAEVSSVPGSADIPSAPVQAASVHIRKPPAFLRRTYKQTTSAQEQIARPHSQFSRLNQLLPFKHLTFVKHRQVLPTEILQTEPVDDQAEVPPVNKRDGRTARREIIKNQIPLLKGKTILPYHHSCRFIKMLEEPNFVKHPQMVFPGSLQAETVKTQFSVPSFFSSKVDSDKDTHIVVSAEKVGPSNIQEAKLLSPTRPSSETNNAKPSSETNRVNRQTDSSEDMSSDVVNKYFAFPAVRIHTDFIADSIARSLDADALTVGKDIFFASGKFNLSTPEGIALLGHELSHVHQQQEMDRPFSGREMNESQYQFLENQALENEKAIYTFYNSSAMVSAPPRRNEVLQVYQNSVVESPSFVYGTSSPASGAPLHFSTIPQLKPASGASGAIPSVFNEAVPEEEASGISETPSQKVNIKEIADRVYSLLKKKLTIERERRGR